jgi:hypothetical protein
MATIAEICELAAASPVAEGHTSQSVRHVWSSLSAYIQQCLFQMKSVVIPGFVQFVLQHQEVHAGTWNVRRSWIPVVTIDPTFSSQFGVSNAVPANAAHHSAQTPILLNAALLSELCGQPRDATVRALKAAVRAIGHQVEKYPRDLVAIEMSGIAVLEFQNRRLSVRWSPAFLKMFEEHCNLSTNYFPKPPSSPSNSAKQQSLASSKSVGTQDRRAIPAPPVLASPNAAAAASVSLPELPQASQQQETQGRPESGSVSPRGGLEVSPRMSPRDRLQLTLSSLPSDVSEYDKRNLTKTAYRRMRQAEDTENWQKQMEAKAKAREAQIAAEREYRERERRRLEEIATNDRQAQLAKRESERTVMSMNSTLAAAREPPLPKAFPANDIILLHRAENRPVSHDVPTLNRQVREQLASQRQEREKVAAVAKRLAEDEQKRIAEQEAKLAEKRLSQEAFNKALAEQVAAAEASRLEQEAALKKPCSPLLNFKDRPRKLSKAAQREERLRISRELEKRTLDAAKNEAQKIKEEAAIIEQRRQQSLANYDATKALRVQSQQQLAADLIKQMQEKDRAAESQRSARRSHVDKALLVNESSDDEA